MKSLPSSRWRHWLAMPVRLRVFFFFFFFSTLNRRRQLKIIPPRCPLTPEYLVVAYPPNPEHLMLRWISGAFVIWLVGHWRRGYAIYDVTNRYYDVTNRYYDVTNRYYDVTDRYYDVTNRYYDVTNPSNMTSLTQIKVQQGVGASLAIYHQPVSMAHK